MKEELIEKIIMALSRYGIDNEELREILYITMDGVVVTQEETAVTVREENKNEWLLQRFIIGKTVAGLAPRSLKFYSDILKGFLREVGKNIDEITTDDIRLYLAIKGQRDGASRTYMDNILRVLRTFYAYLTAEELVPKNPCLKIEKIKSEKKKKEAFSEMEVEKIKRACKNNRERALIELLLSTGCRIFEIANMKIKDISGNKIIVNGKGSKERNCYLNAKAQLTLQEYLEERKDANPYIFPASAMKGVGEESEAGKKIRKVRGDWYRYPELVGSGPQGRDGLGVMVRKIGRRAGVEKCHPHRFRRTCATFALRRGMPIEQVSKLLGHEELQTTQIYLDLNERDLELAHEKYVL